MMFLTKFILLLAWAISVKTPMQSGGGPEETSHTYTLANTHCNPVLCGESAR